MPERNPRLAQIVRRHLDIDLVADTDADEVFAHLAGDVGQDLVTVGESDTEHSPRQHLGYRADQFDWFFFGHGQFQRSAGTSMPAPGQKINPESSRGQSFGGLGPQSSGGGRTGQRLPLEIKEICRPPFARGSKSRRGRPRPRASVSGKNGMDFCPEAGRVRRLL